MFLALPYLPLSSFHAFCVLSMYGRCCATCGQPMRCSAICLWARRGRRRYGEGEREQGLSKPTGIFTYCEPASVACAANRLSWRSLRTTAYPLSSMTDCGLVKAHFFHRKRGGEGRGGGGNFEGRQASLFPIMQTTFLRQHGQWFALCTKHSRVCVQATPYPFCPRQVRCGIHSSL